MKIDVAARAGKEISDELRYTLCLIERSAFAGEMDIILARGVCLHVDGRKLDVPA